MKHSWGRMRKPMRQELESNMDYQQEIRTSRPTF